jgi:acetolactate synthase-1/2/3 large subunit
MVRNREVVMYIDLKIIVLSNSGYGTVRQTEDQWLDGVNVGTNSKKSDLLFPNFSELVNSFGYKVGIASTHKEFKSQLQSLYVNNSIGFLEVKINDNSTITPQTRHGYPLEHSEPNLSRDELRSNIIIPILKD